MAEKANNAPKNQKKRNWGFVLYPDSMPENWREILESSGIPCALSPLHDSDKNATGENKKPHYHGILCYDGPTTFSNVSALVKQLNCPIPIPLESVKGAYRYFTHQDNPEKAQYNADDILHLNGFSPRDFFELSKSEVQSIIKEIHNIIRESNILEYCDLLDILLDSDMPEHYEIASNHTILFNNYISSRRYKAKQAQQNDSTPKPKKTCKPTSTEDMLDDLTGSARGDWLDI